MNKFSAQQVYDKLLNEDKILEVKGQIKFFLGDVDIIVKQKDVVGNIIQEWLEGWLKKNNIAYAPNENTQMPPDIYLDPDDKENNLLEVKAFNYKASPGFDIADFKAYQKEIIFSPYMLFVKYLIFGYTMGEDGYVTINKLWLKNVWEITRPMKFWALNLQVKNNVVHKIRPAKWYAKSSTFKTFECVEDYLSAIEECVYKNPDTHNLAASWKQNMVKGYKKLYKKTLKIPRWDDIKDKYISEKEL
ncbi:MAG: NgoBV family restriction endonuclease [Bacteroidales bacterium]|nr:NgoBV family restriction endonuclease [Bacteroidales bacterium]